jgi:hypothetical protein
LSRQVIWEAQAIDQAAGFLRDHPYGFGEMLDAVARLAEESALPGRSLTGHLTDGGCAQPLPGDVRHHCRDGCRFGTSAAAGPEARGPGIPQTGA